LLQAFGRLGDQGAKITGTHTGTAHHRHHHLVVKQFVDTGFNSAGFPTRHICLLATTHCGSITIFCVACVALA